MKRKLRLWGVVLVCVLLFSSTSAFAWNLTDAAKPYRGQTITPFLTMEAPNMAIRHLVPFFEKETGIKVAVEQAPLPEIMTKMAMMFAGKLGTYDVMYIDKAWMGRYAPHLLPVKEFMEKYPELVDPDFDLDDFFPILIKKQASVNGVFYGFPFDVPLIVLVYRKDIFEESGLKVPETYAEYYDTAKLLTAMYAPKMYGCAVIAKEHYAIVTDYAGILWAYGGTFFDGKGKSSINSPQAIKALEYYKSLIPLAVPGATTMEWGMRIDAVAAGKLAMTLVHQEGFPMMDDPSKSVVSGKLEVAVPPRGPGDLVQDPARLSYGEWPGLARSGGSNYIVNKYSKHPEATYLFVQWATSKEVQKLASVLIGGATPTRMSIFKDPEIIAHHKVVGPDATRHFIASEKAMLETLGFEPNPPQYPRLIAVYYRALSKAVTGRLNIKEALDEAAAETDRIMAEE